MGFMGFLHMFCQPKVSTSELVDRLCFQSPNRYIDVLTFEHVPKLWLLGARHGKFVSSRRQAAFRRAMFDGIQKRQVMSYPSISDIEHLLATGHSVELQIEQQVHRLPTAERPVPMMDWVSNLMWEEQRTKIKDIAGHAALCGWSIRLGPHILRWLDPNETDPEGVEWQYRYWTFSTSLQGMDAPNDWAAAPAAFLGTPMVKQWRHEVESVVGPCEVNCYWG
jgi:hypothetical protein